MAQEIKNTFLKSKMNKDLDDRILPNGEYRDARNISVGRSEDNDVGALENVIGNLLMATTDLDTDGLEIIGLKESPVNDTIYVFLTNYTDSNPASPTNAPEGTLHFIYSFNTLTEEYTRLLQGEFLNFSKSNKIIIKPRRVFLTYSAIVIYTRGRSVSVLKVSIYNSVASNFLRKSCNGYFIIDSNSLSFWKCSIWFSRLVIISI